MIIYYSGDNEISGESIAEDLISGINIMLTYACHAGKIQQDKWRIVRMIDGKTGVESHFLDSGAFTLWSTAALWAEENGKDRWEWFDTDEHWEYLDEYAAFVKKYKAGIDHYANVDAIQNAKLTYRNQKYLEEKHGLNPVPVVHLGDGSIKWLKRYIKEGYDFIGLGGLAGKATARQRLDWLDDCFKVVCGGCGPKCLPCVKLHGFGITSYKMLLRYPWWSVDSVTWAKQGGFGSIFVPHKRNGKFDFSVAPYLIATSFESGKVKESREKALHYSSASRAEQRIIREWLDEIEVPLGKLGDDGEPEEWGVLTRHTERRAANIKFFERLRLWLPEWPWPYDPPKTRTTLGLK